jgi:signal transduction protein with GAF and PtsI domain
MDWSQVSIIVLGSSVVATLVTKAFDYFTEEKQKDEVRRQRLYGPLIYKLMAMDVISKNKKDLFDEIIEIYQDYQQRRKQLTENINPLTNKWKNYIDEIKFLFEGEAAYIKEEDFCLVKDFLDGYIKREITKEGTSIHANKERIEKMLNAIKNLQDKFLP